MGDIVERRAGFSHTPPHIVESVNRALANGRTGYPDNRGELSLPEAVAAKLRRDNRLSYNPATEILVTDGATLGIFTALMALVDPGDGVLIPDPIYDAYQSPIRLTGAQSQQFPLGVTMSLERRLALLAAARRSDARD